MLRLFVVCMFLFCNSVLAQASTITLNASYFGAIRDSGWTGGYTPYNNQHFPNPTNTAYLWDITFGYGDAGYYSMPSPHRANQIAYYNLQTLSSSLNDFQQIVVDAVSFSMSTTEGNRYTGPSAIRAIERNWIPGTPNAVSATWNNIMPSLGSNVLATGSGNPRTTFSSVSGRFENIFSEWINGETQNFGFAILATANSPSSVDGHPLSPVTLNYHIENIPTPEPSTLLFMGIGIVGVGWRKSKQTIGSYLQQYRLRRSTKTISELA